MRTTAIKITPEDYILSVLTPEERLDAAFRVAEAAFKGTTLTMKDVETPPRRSGEKPTRQRNYKSSGLRPVRFPIRANIRGPISSLS